LSRYLDLLTNIGDQVYFNNLLGTVVGVNSQGNLKVNLQTDDTKTLITPEIYIEPGTISLGYHKSSV
jgi:BirA family biotin operon repressor/biotin-[acetyl-CoA-carboxylase] ligase